jgi:serine/threonine protein kinase
MVRHAHTHQIHAMKAISKRSVLANEELDHTLAELSILKRMGDRSEGPSAFVSRLDYAFTDRDNFYFVMEFYSGGDLATQMETLKRLGERRTRFYAADLVQGLEELCVLQFKCQEIHTDSFS